MFTEKTTLQATQYAEGRHTDATWATRNGYLYPDLDQGSIIYVGSNPTVASYRSDLKLPNNTPNFFQKRKNGDFLPMNSYRRAVEQKTGYTGYSKELGPGYEGMPLYSKGYVMANRLDTVYPIEWEGVYINTNAVEEAIVRAKADTKSRLRVGNQKAGLAETAAQMSQLAGLFGSNTLRIVGALNALDKGNLAGAAKALGVSFRKRQDGRFKKSYAKSPDDAIAAFWLELQYGWKPLLSDIYGTAEVLTGLIGTQDVYFKAVASASYSKEEQNPFPGQYTATSIRSKVTYSIKNIVYYRVASMETRTLQQLGIINPAQLAWDLVPFSFVIDWLLPVGNWLQSMTSTVGLEFIAGCRCIKKIQSTSRVDQGHKRGSRLEQQYEFFGSGSKMKFEFVREPLADFPPVNIPIPQNPFSFTHAANALALLQTFKRK